MNWTPAKYQLRSSAGVAMRYSVRPIAKAKKGMTYTTQILVDKASAAKAGLAAGETVRLDLDMAGRMGRIVAARGERKKLSDKNGSLGLCLPWNGDIATCFPIAPSGGPKTLELVIAECSKSEGLIFELPMVAAKAEKRKG